MQMVTHEHAHNLAPCNPWDEYALQESNQNQLVGVVGDSVQEDPPG